jgi:hypothetical protein
MFVDELDTCFLHNNRGFFMQKKNKALLLLSLVGALICGDIIAKQSSLDTFVHGACAVGLGIIGIAGAAKLAEWCFTETNNQLVSRGQSEYSNALRYVDVMNLFENAYGLSGFTMPHSDLIVRNVSEPILYDLATTLWNKKLSQSAYVRDVAYAKNQLRELSSKLHARINDQRGSYLSYDERKTFDAMNELASKVDHLLPRISLFSHYLDYHKSYFSLYDCESKIYTYYDAELRIVKNDAYGTTVAYDLRQAIVWRHSGSRYPFMKFVDGLSGDISSLVSCIRSAGYCYSERIGFANSLLTSLDCIKRIALADERYAREVYQAEQERLERLRIEALQEQARIERAQLDAMREQNRILERNNELRRQEMRKNNSTYQPAAVEVVIGF